MSRRTRIVLIAVACILIVPIAAYASDRFSDVPDDNVFHGDITWLADADVTRGCNPPANTEFCPKDFVTREQMAAFMRRLAENQVVDAATAIEAENASTLDGFEGEDYVPTFILSDESAGNDVAGTDELCVTEEYTAERAQIAVLDARASGRTAAAATTTSFLRTRVSEDGGAFTNTSDRFSPEETLRPDTRGAVSYVDVYELAPGTSYRFGMRLSGATKNNVFCQLTVTVYNQIGDGGSVINPSPPASASADQ